MSEKRIPFGMLFEERVVQSNVTLEPSYDEATDISYAQNEPGKPVPYVELDQRSGDGNAERASLLRQGGTQTITKVRNEQTDQDPSPRPSGPSRPPKGTETLTFVEAETTRQDR